MHEVGEQHEALVAPAPGARARASAPSASSPCRAPHPQDAHVVPICRPHKGLRRSTVAIQHEPRLRRMHVHCRAVPASARETPPRAHAWAAGPRQEGSATLDSPRSSPAVSRSDARSTGAPRAASPGGVVLLCLSTRCLQRAGRSTVRACALVAVAGPSPQLVAAASLEEPPWAAGAPWLRKAKAGPARRSNCCCQEPRDCAHRRNPSAQAGAGDPWMWCDNPPTSVVPPDGVVVAPGSFQRGTPRECSPSELRACLVAQWGPRTANVSLRVPGRNQPVLPGDISSRLFLPCSTCCCVSPAATTPPAATAH